MSTYTDNTKITIEQHGKIYTLDVSSDLGAYELLAEVVRPMYSLMAYAPTHLAMACEQYLEEYKHERG